MLVLVALAGPSLIARAQAAPRAAKGEAKADAASTQAPAPPVAAAQTSDQPGADRAPEPPAQPAASEAPNATQVAPEPAQAEAPVEAMSAARAGEQRQSSLQRDLERVQNEREHTSTLVPWIVTGVGVAALVTGLAVGVGNALSCKGSCRTAFWPGWLVVGGTTAGAVGVVWLERKRRDIAELALRRQELEQELERVHWDTPVATVPAHEHAAALSWHGSF